VSSPGFSLFSICRSEKIQRKDDRMTKKVVGTIILRCLVAGAILTALLWLGYSNLVDKEIPAVNQIAVKGNVLFELPFEVSRLTDVIAAPILFFLIVLVLRFWNASTLGMLFGLLCAGICWLIYFNTANPIFGGGIFLLSAAIFCLVITAIGRGFYYLMESYSNEELADYLTLGLLFRTALGFGLGACFAFCNQPLIFVLIAAVALFVFLIVAFFVPLFIGWGLIKAVTFASLKAYEFFCALDVED